MTNLLKWRVDLWQHQVGFFMEYTSLKTPVDREMAESLAQGLVRQGAGCRIVRVPDEQVVVEWSYYALQESKS